MHTALQNATVTAEWCCISEVPRSAGAVCCRPHTNRAISRQGEPASPFGRWASHVESSHNDRLQGNLPGHAVLHMTLTNSTQSTYYSTAMKLIPRT